ncbi:hypothetical protein [Paracoccus jeotgali]|uniref:Uncharacterized protein n=1 Tax=Paracoccus jeotgali TaxID=2065379 RepID=A0A2K9MCI9_9RHOB|nr:hypothetical protein [Paracoccus jeotgali]AUM73313.1 hypothetical protein CYR75_02510 [Paracoccus jeotgali]
MENGKDETFPAMIEVFRHAYSPGELFNHLTMILMKEPPRQSLPMIAKVFDDCGFQKPIDWF